MYFENSIYLGLDSENKRVNMSLPMCNRHGLIAGASGTGKTITMKCMAESFADAGVPVFLCDVKGDVSGICMPGEKTDGMEKRIDKFGLRKVFQYKAYTTTFWDIYGEAGHPIRATISDMGPELLARILGLTVAQEGVLNIVFKIADDNGLLLTDLKDLRAMLAYVGEHKEEYTLTYGNIAKQSLGAILRALIPLETQGGDLFFGEPDLDIKDWIRTDLNGKGMVNVLHAVRLVQNPKLYAMFLLWMMSELFEVLPEAGDADKPKLVFFFDEAHLLFADAPAVLVQKIEQVVKLIRSKGVGIFFVTQNPTDIPDGVLAQCSNRVQHALKAYTPSEQRAVRAAATSFRPNPSFNTAEVIQTLGIGEALVSVLDEKGVPTVVQQTKIICPQSKMAPADQASRQASLANDGMAKYDQAIDNESAFEVLQQQKSKDAELAKLEAERAQLEKEKAEFAKQQAKAYAAQLKKEEKAMEVLEKRRAREAERRKAKIETQLINSVGQIIRRGILNTIQKGLFGR